MFSPLNQTMRSCSTGYAGSFFAMLEADGSTQRRSCCEDGFRMLYTFGDPSA
jgi:hypothetical protein